MVRSEFFRHNGYVLFTILPITNFGMRIFTSEITLMCYQSLYAELPQYKYWNQHLSCLSNFNFL